MNTSLDEALSLYKAGDLDAAEHSVLATCEVGSHKGAAWHLLGMISHRRGRHELAADQIRRSLSLAPENVEYLVHASELFRLAHRLEEAAASARAAVKLQPDHPAPWNNLGLCLMDDGRQQEAETCYRLALDLAPDYARAHFNLGTLLLRQNRLEEASLSLKEALRLQPGYPQALNALGEILRRQGQYARAAACFRKALKRKPAYSQALLNLGNTFAEMGRNEDAAEFFGRALDADPNNATAYHDLGAFHENKGRLAEAIADYRRAWQLKPEFWGALASLENARRRVCDWSGRKENIPRLLEAVRDSLARQQPSPLWPLASCRFPTDNQERLGIAREHARRIARQVDPRQAPLHERRPALRDGRLRIGFLSHELGNQVAGHLMQELFERFDRSRFEILAFDYTPEDDGLIRNRIRAGCDRFVDIRSMSAFEAAQCIAAEGVHVLLDINSYMPRGRPAIAAWRPAPVQVSYMYPATTGADFVDYFLTDPVVTPPGHERFFTEKLVYLPDVYLPCPGVGDCFLESPGREHWGLPAEAFVFCSFNAADKIDPETFDVWMRILARVPGSVLWQKDDGPLVRANLRREAETRGVSGARIIFAPREPDMGLHLARHRCADLFLDTFNHGAHATAADALRAGLPLLTCPGETFASRVATSLLSTAGLPELIAADHEDFERLAVQLANRPNDMKALRSRLDSIRQSSHLFDSARLVRSLEWAFLEMWRLFESGASPSRIDVPTSL